MATQGLGVNLHLNYAQFTEGINKASSSLKSLEGIAKTAGSAIMANLSFNAIKGMVELGAKVMQTEEAFRNTAKSIGVSSAKWEADIKRASNATVDSSDAMQVAMKAVTAGMKQEDTVKLMEAARLGARRMGQDVSAAYENIVTAVEIQRTKTLNAYNLITKEQMKMIEEIKKAGIEVDLMTVIMGNYEQWAIKMGDATENMNEKIQQSKAIIKDTWETISIGLITTLADAITTLKTFANSWRILWDDIKQATGFGAKPTNQGLLSLVGAGVTGAGTGTKTKGENPNDYLKRLMGQIPDKEGIKAQETIQRVIDNLKFELAQLSRTDEEQKIYNSLKQAGVDINSEYGQTIANIASQIYKVTEAMKVEEELLKRLMDGEEAMYEAWTRDEEKRLAELKYFNDNLRKFAEDEASEWLDQINRSEELTDIYNRMWEQQHEVMTSLKDAWGLTWDEISNNAVNTWTELSDVLVNATGMMSASLASVMVGFIDGTVDAKKAIEDLSKAILTDVIQALIQIGVQQLLLATIGKTIQAASNASTIAGNVAIAASAAPAASLMSMATWGASASVGTAAFLAGLGTSMGAAAAAIAAGQGMGATTGMAEGGVINEHIVGRGMQTGRYYELGEKGPERVTPIGKSRTSNITVNINGNVLNNYDQLARILVPAIRKAEYDGV